MVRSALIAAGAGAGAGFTGGAAAFAAGAVAAGSFDAPQPMLVEASESARKLPR